jgi:hypothetical protein
MDSQVLSHEINIFLGILFYIPDINGLVGTTAYARRQFLRLADAIIALGIEIRDKIGKDNPERTGQAAGLTAGAAHFVPFQVAVSGTLQGAVITGSNTGRFFAVAANGGKGRVFPQVGYAIILRMVEILAADFAFGALIADIEVNIEPFHA